MEPTAQARVLETEKHNVIAFPVVGSARPKRRWKTVNNESPQLSRAIVPIRSEGTRPVKFTRTGKSFQIWKAPASHAAQPEVEKTTPAALFRDFLGFYMRAIISQSGARFRLLS